MMSPINPLENQALNEFRVDDTEALNADAEDDAETRRKQLSYKRTMTVFIVVSLILAAFILWEIVDLSLGGRP